MHKENCLICGEKLQYLDSQEEMKCSLCNKVYVGNARCEAGHFICDSCHREKGLAVIKDICGRTESKNPLEIIEEIMAEPFIYMHGPEHHIMVGAALLAAYKNAGGQIDFETCLAEMIRRGSQVPGGFCGYWGCCGAAVSCGAFLSVITGTTPLSAENGAIAQKGTAAALEEIAAYSGSRCCKRNSFLSILKMIDFAASFLDIEMEGGADPIICAFSVYNEECIEYRCPFFRSKD